MDRVALDLGPEDTLLTITSAGCNVLDYALLGPKHIYAVDMNYRQNALLELKLAGIRALEFGPFFAMFGGGCLDNYRTVYMTQLRPLLSPVAQRYWDRHIVYFARKGWRRTFYFRGTSGFFARLMNAYIDHVARVRDGIEALFDACSLDEQRDIYHRYLRCAVRKRFVRWLLRQDVTLSLIDRALLGTRILWRSGGLRVDYVDPIKISQRGRWRLVGDLLTYHRDLAEALHRQDRVHTYGSFYIADLATA